MATAMQPVAYAFRLCGLLGYALAFLLAVVLAERGGLAVGVIAALAAAGAAVFLALAMATKIVSGRESLTYYHHQAAVLLADAMVLWWMREPLLPYLDLAVLGLGIFLACGRVGCLWAGCCHGVPFRHGVRYGREYLGTGFPAHLAEVRLFPVQAIESLWVAAIVGYGVLLVTASAPAGSTLAEYLVLYPLGRFFLEFLRAGLDRPFFRGFSAAQWTSFALACGTVGAEAAGVLPRSAWHTLIPAAMLAAGAAVRLHPRLRMLHRLFAPSHLREFAEALDLAYRLAAAEARQSPGERAIHLAATSMGIQVSCGELPGREPAWHLTVSRHGTPLTGAAVETVCGLLRQLARLPEPVQVVPGSPGTYHLLMRSPVDGQSPPSKGAQDATRTVLRGKTSNSG